MFVIIQRIQKSNGNCSLLVQHIFTIPGILYSVSTNSKNTHHILKYISSIIFEQFDTKQIGEFSGRNLYQISQNCIFGAYSTVFSYSDAVSSWKYSSNVAFIYSKFRRKAFSTTSFFYH